MAEHKLCLDGGDELFFHPDVVAFFQSIINLWESEKRIALLLGCTVQKPYSSSFMHRKIISLIQTHGFDSTVQQYIIGEPLVAVPREWETKFPAANYNFPPSRLGTIGRGIFINRLNQFLTKVSKSHDRFIVFAPNHHKNIIFDATKGIGIDVIVVPYNLYTLPRLLRMLKEVVDD